MAQDTVTRPSEIGDLKEDLVEAVINAYMAKRVPELTGLHFEKGACKDKEFRFTAKADGSIPGIDLERDPEFYCSYPGGDWKEAIPQWWDSDAEAGDSTAFGTEALPDAKAIYEMVRSEVDAWLDPWATGHSANEFTNQTTSLANVANQLYVGDQTNFGGPGTGGQSGGGTGAVTDVRSALDNIDNLLGDMHGSLINAFQNTYASDIWRTLGGQRGLATAAALALAAEALAWNEALTTMRDFVIRATYDFNQLAGGRDGSGQALQATLGAVSAISSLVGATVGLAIPPVAAVAGVVGGVSGVAAIMFPAQPGVTPAPLVLNDQGDDYMSYWNSFKDHVTAISDDLSAAEDAIGAGCRRMLRDFQVNPDNYSIGLITRRGGQEQGDQLGLILRTGFEYDHGKLRSIAGCVESIGDHQRAVAGRLGGADGAGNPAALAPSEWERGALPAGGYIGYGHNGPYEDYAALVNETIDLLLLEQRTAHRIAEHIIASVLELQATDREREAALNRAADPWDTHSVPNVNG